MFFSEGGIKMNTDKSAVVANPKAKAHGDLQLPFRKEDDAELLGTMTGPFPKDIVMSGRCNKALQHLRRLENLPLAQRLLAKIIQTYVPGVSPRVSPKMGGVRGSVRRGVVQKVSRECPRSVKIKGVPDTPGTLSGHFLDTLEPEARRARDTPSHTPSDTPHFRGHSPGHSGDTSGPRDSCSRPGGSQDLYPQKKAELGPYGVYKQGRGRHVH